MKIPMTEKEFVKDIINTCGMPTSRYMSSNAPIWIDNVKNRLMEYGVEGRIFPSGSIFVEDYLSRMWKLNSHAILSVRGLKPQDDHTLTGSSSLDLPYVNNWLQEIEDSEEWNNGWFTRLPYHERKFITPVKSYDDYRPETPDIVRFRISHIPADIKFEDCIPTVGELYIAHPHRVGVYLPVSKYEHLIFRERIHELSKVMMSLGATEIKTLQNLDNKINSSSEESSNTNASAGIRGLGKASGFLSSLSQRLQESQKSDSVVINFKSDPIDQPHLPEGLIWYPYEKEWQHIAECRLHGNILEYEINLSSKETNLVSELERSNIEAQAKVLFASASFSHSSYSQTFFKEESAKSTSILIKFKSRKDY